MFDELMKLKTRRVGQFKVTRNALDCGLFPLLVSQLGITIIYATAESAEDVFVYKAVSPYFDEIKEGETVPLYLIIATVTDGETAFSVKKV